MRVAYVAAGNTDGGIERARVSNAQRPLSCPELTRHSEVAFSAQLEIEPRSGGVDVTRIGAACVSPPSVVAAARDGAGVREFGAELVGLVNRLSAPKSTRWE